MASTIKIRNSSTTGSAPSSLVQGELAINVADGNIFYGNGSTVNNNIGVGALSSSGAINAGGFILSSSVASDPFIVRMDNVAGDAEKFKINTQGIVVLGAPDSVPTAVEGAIYYKDGIFYFGDND